MIEAGIAVGVAAIAGLASLTQRITSRINEVDRRLNDVELSMAENYVRRREHLRAMERFEEHMVRIEQKLDLFIQTYPNK